MRQVGYQYVNAETEFECISGDQIAEKKEKPKNLCCSIMKFQSDFAEIDGEELRHGGGEYWYGDNLKLETKYGRRYWTISSSSDKLYCYTDVLSSKQCDVPLELDWKCTRGSWSLFNLKIVCSSEEDTTTTASPTKPAGEIPIEVSTTSTSTTTSTTTTTSTSTSTSSTTTTSTTTTITEPKTCHVLKYLDTKLFKTVEDSWIGKPYQISTQYSSYWGLFDDGEMKCYTKKNGALYPTADHTWRCLDTDGYFSDTGELTVQCIDYEASAEETDLITISYKNVQYIFGPGQENGQYKLRHRPHGRYDVIVRLNNHWTWIILEDESFTATTMLKIACFTVDNEPIQAKWFCNE